MNTTNMVKTTTVLLATTAFAVTAQTPFEHTFSDDAFTNSDWTAAKVYDTTSGQTATFSATQNLAGGNPGPYRFVVHDYGVGNIGIAHLKTTAFYSPVTNGPIASLTFAYDLRAFQVGVSAAIGYYPLLVQDGRYFILQAQDLVAVNSWRHFSHTGLTASDFAPLDGGSEPDFSAGAPPIQFGFYTSNGTQSGVGHTESGIDNWTAVVTPVPLHLSIQVSQVRLCWNSETNRQYRLQYRSEFTTNQWVDFGTPILGTGTTNCLTDEVTTPRRFYRVIALP
jgi:hypothetical protein